MKSASPIWKRPQQYVLNSWELIAKD
jgi:hypothetical protein